MTLETIGRQPRIAVVGSLNMDFVVRAPRIPMPGETVLGGGDLQTIPGGKGANQALAAKRLGGNVSMIGKVGADPFGNTLRSNLAEAGVDVSAVLTQPETSSGIALVTVDERGQNSIVVSAGANQSLGRSDVEAARHLIEQADILIMQLEVPEEAIVAASSIARNASVTTLLNPAPARRLSADLLSQIDFIVPNETEVGLMTGVEVHSDRNIAQSVDSIRALGVPTVVITRGNAGATFVTSEEVGHVPAYNVDAVDTTACGDAFVAAFAVSLAGGDQLTVAIGRGNAAGALAATLPGAQPSLPMQEAVEAMLTGPARKVRSSIITSRLDDNG